MPFRLVMDPESSSDDEEDCPELVVGVETEKKIPVTIITGYLGNHFMETPESTARVWHLFDRPISKILLQDIWYCMSLKKVEKQCHPLFKQKTCMRPSVTVVVLASSY